MLTPPTPIPDPPASFGLLLLRLGTGGLLFFAHGWGKLLGYGERAPKFADPIGLGSEVGFTLVVFTEIVCAALVMIGMFTRLATVPMLIFFGVAAFVHHAADPWPRRELPMLYGIACLTLLLTGAGRWSVDAWWHARRGNLATRSRGSGS
jgi:putative oxidoreductase